MTEAYPLAWPEGWPRTASYNRKRAKFGKTAMRGETHQWRVREDLTIDGATKRVMDELRALKVMGGRWIISSNLELRIDGLPRSGQRQPEDPGVAVYWSIGDKKRVMAIDLYDRVADNLAAVAATLYAMRAIDRHGGAQILERAFAGFAQLPPPTGHQADRPVNWKEELGPIIEGLPNDEMLEVIEARYRKAAKLSHADAGGEHDKMVRLNLAMAQAREALA